MRKYEIVWKGEAVGNFTREEIAESFARGAVGMLHSVVLDGGREVGVGEFLASSHEDGATEDAQPDRGASPCAGSDFAVFGYLMGGLSFVSVCFCVSAFVFAFFLFRAGDRKTAAGVCAAAFACAVLGLFFFRVILPEL